MPLLFEYISLGFAVLCTFITFLTHRLTSLLFSMKTFFFLKILPNLNANLPKDFRNIPPSDGVYHLQEPWILHDFSEDFYGEELRLVVVGYIRPEVSFPLLTSIATPG